MVGGLEWGGGAGGTRTPYLFNAIEALSRLSYSPICGRLLAHGPIYQIVYWAATGSDISIKPGPALTPAGAGA